MKKYVWAFILILGVNACATFAQSEKSECVQDESEKLKFIKEADDSKHRVINITVSGNSSKTIRNFRKVMEFDAGDIFNAKLLEKTIKNSRKLKQMYPISFEDVGVSLDRKEKRINFIFCLRDKKKI